MTLRAHASLQVLRLARRQLVEREVWALIVAFLGRIDSDESSRRFVFSGHEIALVYLWAVLHDRPVYWACQRANWADDLRPVRLPNPSTMTRRLRSEACRKLFRIAHRRLQQGTPRGLLHIADGKPLPISKHSHDPEAGYGRGAGAMAKGYKLHVIAGRNQHIRAWRVRPMQVSEPKVAGEMVREAKLSGYLLGDRLFDDNPLHETCRQHGLQLLAERRFGPHRGLGHRWHSPGRLRCIELLEQSQTGFGLKLLQERGAIERLFGQLSSAAYGLHTLPPWVRHADRVERYVSAKILIFTLVQKRRKRAQ